MASSSSRVLRSRSSRMTPYSVKSERKGRKTPSESDVNALILTVLRCIHDVTQ